MCGVDSCRISSSLLYGSQSSGTKTRAPRYSLISSAPIVFISPPIFILEQKRSMERALRPGNSVVNVLNDSVPS